MAVNSIKCLLLLPGQPQNIYMFVSYMCIAYCAGRCIDWTDLVYKGRFWIICHNLSELQLTLADPLATKYLLTLLCFNSTVCSPVCSVQLTLEFTAYSRNKLLILQLGIQSIRLVLLQKHLRTKTTWLDVTDTYLWLSHTVDMDPLDPQSESAWIHVEDRVIN